MITRLFSAVWSWVASSPAWCRLRWDRMPMVAMSASLPDADVGVAERAGAGAEQVQDADHGRAQAHGQGVDGDESGQPGCLGELGPALGAGLEIGVDHRCTGTEGVEAGARVGLEFEQLQKARVLAGGGRGVQLPVLVGDDQAHGVHIEQLHAALGQGMEEHDDVEIVRQCVGGFDEGLGQLCFTTHAHASTAG
jgi:uncharacterized protein YidB (DUF937 family)